MGIATAKTTAPPAGIASLAERYDPDVIDVPGGRALVRLEVRGGDDWDARISGRRLRVVPARPASEGAPDATMSADAATWQADRVGRARRDDRLPAGSPAHARQPAPGRGAAGGHERLAGARAARVRDADDALGQDLDPVGRRGPGHDPLPARPRRDQGVLPPHRRGDVGRVPGGRDGPARVRRVRQADRGRLRRGASSRARPSTRWTPSESTRRTWSATAWAAGWRSRPA